MINETIAFSLDIILLFICFNISDPFFWDKKQNEMNKSGEKQLKGRDRGDL